MYAGLTLLGFKPRAEVKRHYHVKPASFIYPDESVSVQNSQNNNNTNNNKIVLNNRVCSSCYCEACKMVLQVKEGEYSFCVDVSLLLQSISIIQFWGNFIL